MSAYAVNKVCYLVARDPSFREGLRADPDALLARFEPPLSEDERSALVSGEVGQLSALGAHDFLLLNLFRFSMFSLDLPTYVERMKAPNRIRERAEV